MSAIDALKQIFIRDTSFSILNMVDDIKQDKTVVTYNFSSRE